MSGSSFLRQQDLVSAERLSRQSITVIGAGAIGSFTVLSLAKMGGMKLTVYDHDLVEPHNLPNQFYRIEDLDKAKVMALGEIVREYTGVEVEVRPEKYLNQQVRGMVIVAVDSMDERKRIWKVLRHQVDQLIDARMGAEVAVVYVVNPLVDAERYESTLYSSKEALAEPCTRKAIIYTALGVASMICAQVRALVMNEAVRKETVIDFKLGTIIP